MEDKTQLPGVLCSPSDIWKKLARPILLHFHLEWVPMTTTQLVHQSNQIYLVTFMCLTVDTIFIFTKK